MNVFYEEDGGFKVARVMEDIGTSLQVEALTGKRSKIKANAVLLRFPNAADGLLQAAEALALEIDPDFLYEVCGDAEFAFDALAVDYFGHAATPPEAAAIALKLHGTPMYFYKRGRGRYQKAPAENLKAALASIERKAREATQMEAWIGALKGGTLPEEIRPHLAMVLYKPDRNTLVVKACEKAAEESGLSLPALFFAAGAWADRANASHTYHVDKFLAEYFPKGADEVVDFHLDSSALEQLPLAEVEAYSIDDAETTEIDDAFSVVQLDPERIEVGIHIAAPTLFFDQQSALEAHAAKRLSTVYHPAGKITMLPKTVIEQSTLAAGRNAPVVSLYVQVRLSADTVELMATRSVIERVPIRANLRLNELETRFTEEAIHAGAVAGKFGPELLKLHAVARHLRAARGAKDESDKLDFNMTVADGEVTITTRKRGNPIDTVVAEMMIFANATWGKFLAANQVAAIYRAQQNQRTRMTTDVLPHEGLGVECYAWSSSPLRRYVDLVNQRQLIALLRNEPPIFNKRSRDSLSALNQVARTFDATYEAYADFQRNMERYWSLCYLERLGQTEFAASIIRDEVIRASGLPMIVKLRASPNLPSKTAISVEVAAIDYWAIDAQFSLKPVPVVPDPEPKAT